MEKELSQKIIKELDRYTIGPWMKQSNLDFAKQNITQNILPICKDKNIMILFKKSLTLENTIEFGRFISEIIEKIKKDTGIRDFARIVDEPNTFMNPTPGKNSLSEKKHLKEYFATGPVEKNNLNFNYRTKTYKDKVLNYILDIFLDINQVSEKSYGTIDDISKKLKYWVDDHADDLDLEVSKFEKSNERIELCGEFCYRKFFKNNDLGIKKGEQNFFPSKTIELDEFLAFKPKTLKESKEFDSLKKNKVELTPEEKKKVFQKNAVWHNTYSINPLTGKKEKKNSAIWKAKDSKGNVTYVTHTHRAYNTATTLDTIINKYHNFIKGTA